MPQRFVRPALRVFQHGSVELRQLRKRLRRRSQLRVGRVSVSDRSNRVRRHVRERRDRPGELRRVRCSLPGWTGLSLGCMRNVCDGNDRVLRRVCESVD